ncbi:MAG TPA: DMT family transporter, partial [Acidimicrobiales bacterium]|nr:DMT family transporter [Acidimicrobiales bacterium]
MTVVLAATAACCFALGNVLQQRGALRTSAPGEQFRFLVEIFRHPVWVAGLLLQVAGFGAQVAALGSGSLLVVQAIVVTNFVIALPFGVWLTDQVVGWRQVIGALATLAGLVVLLVGGHPGGVDHLVGAGWVVALAVVAAAVVGFDLASRRVGPAPAAALLGAAAGTVFGVQAGLIKSLSHHGGGSAGLFGQWELYVLVVAALVGFAYQQRGLKVGVLAPTMAASNVATLLTSVVLGLALFDETLRHGVAGPALAVPGLALMAGG